MHKVTELQPPSNLEKTTGNLLVTASTTFIAAVSGTAVGALLPVLTSTLASNRHSKRIEATIIDINNRLSKIENIDKSLTDAQYKLISELVLTILNTPDEEKISHLKHAVYETPLVDALTMHEATILSRALNAISIGELKLLVECHGSGIIFNSFHQEGFYNIDKFSYDGECAVGLISLGLLARSPAEGRASDIGAYNFTPLADNLVKLLIKQ